MDIERKTEISPDELEKMIRSNPEYQDRIKKMVHQQAAERLKKPYDPNNVSEEKKQKQLLNFMKGRFKHLQSQPPNHAPSDITDHIKSEFYRTLLDEELEFDLEKAHLDEYWAKATTEVTDKAREAKRKKAYTIFFRQSSDIVKSALSSKRLSDQTRQATINAIKNFHCPHEEKEGQYASEMAIFIKDTIESIKADSKKPKKSKKKSKKSKNTEEDEDEETKSKRKIKKRSKNTKSTKRRKTVVKTEPEDDEEEDPDFE